MFARENACLEQEDIQKNVTRDDYIRYKIRFQKCSRIKNKDSLKFQLLMKNNKETGSGETLFEGSWICDVSMNISLSKTNVICFDEIHVQYQ